MPITRIEYQSEDGRRSATVLWLSERRWHVTRRVHTTRPDGGDYASTTGIRPKVARTLTSAQGIARTWCERRG